MPLVRSHLTFLRNLQIVALYVASTLRPIFVATAIFAHKYLILLVPGERFELPTNGLQNRCSTAELTRLEFEIA
jgi:hypothetical protein